MKECMKRRSRLWKATQAVLLSLAFLLTVVGCNVADDDLLDCGGSPEGGGTDATTVGTDGQLTEEVTEAQTQGNPPQIPPPAVVTKRGVGISESGAGSGVFNNGDHWFYAVVLEVYGDAILVQPYTNAEERQSADRIWISTQKPSNGSIPVPALFKDSLIRVVYDGVITEGDPARILSPVRFESLLFGFGANGMDCFCAGVMGAGYFSNAEIYRSPLRKSEEGMGTVFHITSTEELKEMLDLFVVFVAFDSSTVATRCGQENFLLATYGDAYFAENDLVISYIVSGSGSRRHFLEEVTVEDGVFSMLVEQWHPPVGTCDMAGWFALAEVDKDAMADVTAFQCTVRDYYIGSSPDTLGEEEQTEINDAWRAQNGTELGLGTFRSVVYCGNYGDCAAITVIEAAEMVTTIDVAGCRFRFSTLTEIWIYRDGQFLSLRDAYAQGWMSERQVRLLNANCYDYVHGERYVRPIS